MAYPNQDKELEYKEWLKSIAIVDKDGHPVEPRLQPDDSEDPENDRGEE